MAWQFPQIQPGETVTFLDNPARDIEDGLPMFVTSVADDVLEGIVFNREGRASFKIRVTHIQDPRVQDPQYLNSIMAEEEAGFFVELTRDLLIQKRLKSLETALGLLAADTKTGKAQAAKVLAELKEFSDDEPKQPSEEVNTGPVIPMSERFSAGNKLTDEEKAAKMDALSGAKV